MIRYTQFPFPAEVYVPGIAGVRPAEEPLASEGITPVQLSELPLPMNPFFLFGADLYNHEFFWEAHEAWETIWRLEENPAVKNFLKGLIQLSGTYLKIIQNNESGAHRLLHRSVLLLNRDLCREMGVQLEGFHDRAESDNGIDTLRDFPRIPLTVRDTCL